MQRSVIEADGLTKYYGKSRGVVDVDLTVNEGEVFGFLGPNGAGKTTTIRLMLDLIRPTRGSVRLFGSDVRRDGPAVRARVGFLSSEAPLYENLTGREAVVYFGNLRGGVDYGHVEVLAERLDCDLSRKIGDLSRGNRQKVSIIQAFMHRPALLILDEPTSGLDPLVQQTFHDLVLEASAQGQTVFVSSHVLPEVERICDRVGIIREGRLVTVEHVTDLKHRAVRRLEFHFGGKLPQDVFAGVPGVSDVRQQDGVVQCRITGSLDQVIKRAAQFEIVDVISHEPSLEEVFLAFYATGKEWADAE